MSAVLPLFVSPKTSRFGIRCVLGCLRSSSSCEDRDIVDLGGADLVELAAQFSQLPDADGRMGDVPIAHGRIPSDIGVPEVNDADVARVATKYELTLLAAFRRADEAAQDVAVVLNPFDRDAIGLHGPFDERQKIEADLLLVRRTVDGALSGSALIAKDAGGPAVERRGINAAVTSDVIDANDVVGQPPFELVERQHSRGFGVVVPALLWVGERRTRKLVSARM